LNWAGDRSSISGVLIVVSVTVFEEFTLPKLYSAEACSFRLLPQQHIAISYGILKNFDIDILPCGDTPFADKITPVTSHLR
jgi:hypothetical protein